MKSVLRSVVPVDDHWHPVLDGPVVMVGCREQGVVEVWTEEFGVPGSRINTEVRMRAFGTGQPVPEHMAHVGSTLDGPWVWHLYRMVAPE